MTHFYVAFTLKISFYHVFFGLAWCKTLQCYIHRTYNVLSKNVTRDVSQLEKTLSEVI